MRPAPVPTFIAAVAVLAAGCGKVASNDVDAAAADAAPATTPDAAGDTAPDAGPDASVAVPAGLDCKQIHDNQPEQTSGRYLIDPDGAGGDPPFEVACDMATDGGGWTVVLATSRDYAGDPVEYTSASAALLGRSSTALIAYRRDTGVVRDNYATFPLPQAWKTRSPFSYLAEDVTLEVKVDGETAATQRMLRFGRQNFASMCGDAWAPAAEGSPEFAPYGRLCIVGTRAPFFNGWADNRPDIVVDFCAASDAPYSSVRCAADRRFSIAVR